MATAPIRMNVVNGINYFYDQTRAKLLSGPRVYMTAGLAKRTVVEEYLRVDGGSPTTIVGGHVVRNGTIVGLAIQCESNSTWTLEVYKKGTPGPIATISMVASTAASNNALNVDVNTGDILQFKAIGTNIPYPRSQLELAWRL